MNERILHPILGTGKISQTFLVIFILTLAVLVPRAWAEDLHFRIETLSVNFPTPTERSLNQGFVEIGNRSTAAAIKIKISGGESSQRWRLYVRASDTIFSPGGYNKKCSDLQWKLNDESSNAYRRLRTSERLVASGSGGQTETTSMDLRMLLGWNDPPAAYRLRLRFILRTD